MRTTALATAALVLSAAAITAPTVASAASKPQVRIARAFMELGMEKRVAACYGAVIVQELKPKNADRAAQIVESASDSEEVRRGVKNSGLDIVDAFSVAHNNCER